VISKLNRLSPAVIAIDLTFVNNSTYDDDLRLLTAIEACKSLVMASAILRYREVEGDHDFEGYMYQTEPHFLLNAKTGFVNALGGHDTENSLSKFSTYVKVNGEIEYHFSVRTAMVYDSLKAFEFVKGNPKIVTVDYKDGKRKFKTFSSSYVRDGKLVHEDISQKIVMLGFLGPGDEDKFFTPLNSNSGRPDMYGLEYLANVVSQVLE
jgi:CHASE2 domain-containing sensor protein